jgi:hypothetical protein
MGYGSHFLLLGSILTIPSTQVQLTDETVSGFAPFWAGSFTRAVGAE